MKRYVHASFILIVLSSLLFALPVYADMSPSHRVKISFSNLPESEVIVTLLSERASTGAFSAYDVNREFTKSTPPIGHEKAWAYFYSYQDTDGYYFIQFSRSVTEGKAFEWNHYPPFRFKILVYLPDSGVSLVSDSIQERYSFSSIFRVDLSRAEHGKFPVAKGSALPLEVLAFLLRLILTITVEIGVAILLGFNKKSKNIIVVVNIVTQIMLNIYAISSFPLTYPLIYGIGILGVLSYGYMELAIIVLESIAYAILLEENGNRAKPITYGVIANLSSWLIGIFLAGVLPIVF